ncbi:MAG TPA: acyl-CoA dehydrogenase family protein [Gemmatimonadaceae bacterium]|jgi:alkylation response protein AidB-like acyl-CoA dehydrogenase|nr:acyl-CoA dehydrogenase family protein [Gemmatimonadaceae bacterium]
MSEFYQTAPALGNQYTDDPALRDYLAWKLPGSVLASIEPSLTRLGSRVMLDVLAAGDDAESRPPRHVPYDAWGRRVDRIEVADGWRALDRIAAEEGLVAIGYERAHGAWSRVDQFARLYLYAPSSATYSCPLAMTDGAARCLELHADPALRDHALPHLLSRDPSQFWTSGQWMTERTGGSDVSGTSTVARCEDGTYRLHGTKWFTSATTAQVALTLARPDGAPSGSRGLSMFYVELRDAAGALRGIRVLRLKDKLGTKALPTAELSLEGTPARLVGELGRGVPTIAAMLTITRIHNACNAVAGMRRAINLARAYAATRVAFGRPLAEHPLHVETLAGLEVECQGALYLVFALIELLGKEECGEASESERALLRLLTPVAKLFTGKQAVATASEVIESFGGAGYVEDTGLPRLLRDAQVLSIWEGTTNVLSLDVLRAIDRDGVLGPALADLRRRVPAHREERTQILQSLDLIERLADAAGDPGAREARARALAFGLARTAIAVLLLEHAAAGSTRAALVARRWCAQPLVVTPATDGAALLQDR